MHGEVHSPDTFKLLKTHLASNIKVFEILGDRLLFGSQRGRLNMTTVWYDAYIKERYICQSPFLEQTSCMYNIAVCCMHLGNGLVANGNYVESVDYY